MPGCITHLAVADRILQIAGNKIADAKLFMAGNIAPDAIHSRENFDRDMKRHTHLKDGIHDAVFLEKENTEVFYQRLEAFVKKYCVKGAENFDLYCGYVSHLLTDRFFIETVRLEFVREMEKLGVRQSDKEFFYKISYDLDNIDARLSREFPFVNRPEVLLKSVNGYEITDYLTADELDSSRGWVVWNFFDNKKTFSNPEFISYERVADYVEYAADKVLKRLGEYGLY